MSRLPGNRRPSPARSQATRIRAAAFITFLNLNRAHARHRAADTCMQTDGAAGGPLALYGCERSTGPAQYRERS